MNIQWLDEDRSPLNDTRITTTALYTQITDQAHAFSCPDGRHGELIIKKHLADTFFVWFRDSSDGFHYEISRTPLLSTEDFEQRELHPTASCKFADFLQRICTRRLYRISHE
jgi:hypothetical protein